MARYLRSCDQVRGQLGQKIAGFINERITPDPL